MQETNDALIDAAKPRDQRAAQPRQVDSLRDYLRLARLRDDCGYTSYLEVSTSALKLSTDIGSAGAC